MTSATTAPAASIALMAVSACIALALPILVFLFARRRYKARFLPMLLGAVTFFLFALVLERLFAKLLMSNAAIQGFLTSRWWVYALYGGLQAGLFEETGRLCAFSLLHRRRSSSLGGALAYGAGHGGIEAILFCTVPMVSYIVYAVILNTSGMGALAALTGGDAPALALINMPPITFLAGGVERIIAVAFHLAASVLVWMAVSGRGPWGLYFLAILFHTLINIPAGMYQYGVLANVWLVELITAALVAAACFITLQIHRKCAQSYSPLLHYEPTDFGI